MHVAVRNRPLMSDDSSVEEVCRRRTSVTSHRLDQSFGGVGHPNLIFGMSRHPRHPQRLRHTDGFGLGPSIHELGCTGLGWTGCLMEIMRTKFKYHCRLTINGLYVGPSWRLHRLILAGRLICMQFVVIRLLSC